MNRLNAYPWVTAVLVLLGCTRSASDPTPSEDEEAQLTFALPAGVLVGLDGATPIPPSTNSIPLELGSHAMTVQTKCQTLTVDFEATSTMRFDPSKVPELKIARLSVGARDKADQRLSYTATIDGEVVAQNTRPQTVVVPGCTYRLRIASEGLGASVEDIDFGVESSVTRDATLLPGPDTVHFQGGPFMLGPPDRLKEYWADDDLKVPIFQEAAYLEPFALDRSEVTVAMWLACREGGGCPYREAMWWSTIKPVGEEYELCNASPVRFEAQPVPSREHHPMNCVARWEAEDYCRWAGKRLPTPIEFEYAARSANEDYEWPWGNEKPGCDHGQTSRSHIRCGEPRGTAEVCTHPAGNSRQGVCDLTGNVVEYVDGKADVVTPSNPRGVNCMDYGWVVAPVVAFKHGRCWRDSRQEADVGFRCARSIAKTQVER